MLNKILSAVTSANSPNQAPGGNSLSSQIMSQVLIAVIQRNGGVQGLLGKFSQNGMSDLVSSWTGTGANKQPTPDQVCAALGQEQIGQLASECGVSANELPGLLAGLLPQMIDQCTPSGNVEERNTSAAAITNMLPSLLAGLGRS